MKNKHEFAWYKQQRRINNEDLPGHIFAMRHPELTQQIAQRIWRELQ